MSAGACGRTVRMTPSALLAVFLWGLLGRATAEVDASAMLKAGDTAFASSQFHESIKLYSLAIDLDPKQAFFYTKRAAAHISLRQFSQATRDLSKAIEVDPAYVPGYSNRGKLYKQLCKLDLAQKDFEQVLQLRPSSATALKDSESLARVRQLLATVQASSSSQSDLHQVASIKAALEQLYAEAQDCIPAMLIEAELYTRGADHERDHEQVVAVTGKVLKSEPGNLQALTMRATAYFYLADHDMAKRHCGEVFKYDPDYSPAMQLFKKVKDFEKKKAKAVEAEAERDYHKAADFYIQALNVDASHRTGNIALWLGLCRARYHVQAFDTAIYDCTNTLVLDPNNVEAKVLRIRAYMAGENWQEAVNKAREAAGQHQENGELRGLVHEAEKRLKMSLRKDYYKILGVDRQAGEREIKQAYRAMAKQFHPDKVAAEEREQAEAKFRDIAEAYEVLSDEDKRRRFDAGEDLNDQGQGGGGGDPFSHFHHGGGQRFTFRFN